MEKLIEQIKNLKNSEELPTLGNVKPNELLYAIADTSAFHLLDGLNIRLDLNDKDSLKKLVYHLLDPTDYAVYFLPKHGYYFTKEEQEAIFTIFLQNGLNKESIYKINDFFKYFFKDTNELSTFVSEHKSFFKRYIPLHHYEKTLCKCSPFLEMTLNEGIIAGEVKDYPIASLKLLANLIRKKKIAYQDGNEYVIQRLMAEKDNLELEEVYELFNSFQKTNIVRISKLRKISNKYSTVNLYLQFEDLIRNNIDYLLKMIDKVKDIPRCLKESSLFRDECIKKQRIDLAVQCVLSRDIIQNEELIKAYCQELHISTKDFYNRFQWILDYYKKNSDIFSLLLGTSLKDKIFNIKKIHYERFINDISIQNALSRLNDRELDILGEILNLYDYKDYDITLMITNIINNINSYQKLINSINIHKLTKSDWKQLVSVLQTSNNLYQIGTLEDLKNYDTLKKQYFTINYETSDLNANKNYLLEMLFNIDLKEAQYINLKYCHDTYYNGNANILDILKNSELPPKIYSYLALINEIIECNNKEELYTIYNNLKDQVIYNKEIPLEPYLRSIYTKLYSQTLYRIEEKNNVYGPKDNIMTTIRYKDKDIKVCIPRTNFTALVRVIGGCSSDEVASSNYHSDWQDRPQIYDHFVACTCVDERFIFSLFGYDGTAGKIVFAFNELEGSAILAMHNADMDSIGEYDSYNAGRDLQKISQNSRIFIPSQMFASLSNPGSGHFNEFVIERRNNNYSPNNEFKRNPTYIILFTNSLDQNSLVFLEDLLNTELSFLSNEDKKELLDYNYYYRKNNIRQILKKYKEPITNIANLKGIPPQKMLEKYVCSITDAINYERSLQAASEFNIPLLLIDRTYYYNRKLQQANLDEKTIKELTQEFAHADSTTKKKMYEDICFNQQINADLINTPKNITI